MYLKFNTKNIKLVFNFIIYFNIKILFLIDLYLFLSLCDGMVDMLTSKVNAICVSVRIRSKAFKELN